MTITSRGRWVVSNPAYLTCKMHLVCLEFSGSPCALLQAHLETIWPMGLFSKDIVTLKRITPSIFGPKLQSDFKKTNIKTECTEVGSICSPACKWCFVFLLNLCICFHDTFYWSQTTGSLICAKGTAGGFPTPGRVHIPT